MKKVLGLLVCVLITWALGTAAADGADPTGKFGIGLQLRGGLDLASKGSIEYLSDFEGEFSHPLGISTFVARYYVSPEMDLEIGFNLYNWSMKEDQGQYTSEVSLTDIPLSFGLFLRSSLGDDAHIRSGGRLNIDILSASVKYGPSDDSQTEITLGAEAALGIEWFISQHFSLTPEAQLRWELPNETTNSNTSSLTTGFQLTVTVIP